MLLTCQSFEAYLVARVEKRWEESRKCIAMQQPNPAIHVDTVTRSQCTWLHLCICCLNGPGASGQFLLRVYQISLPINSKNKQTKKITFLCFVPFHFLFLNYHFQEFLILFLLPIQEHASIFYNDYSLLKIQLSFKKNKYIFIYIISLIS